VAAIVFGCRSNVPDHSAMGAKLCVHVSCIFSKDSVACSCSHSFQRMTHGRTTIDGVKRTKNRFKVMTTWGNNSHLDFGNFESPMQNIALIWLRKVQMACSESLNLRSAGGTSW